MKTAPVKLGPAAWGHALVDPVLRSDIVGCLSGLGVHVKNHRRSFRAPHASPAQTLQADATDADGAFLFVQPTGKDIVLFLTELAGTGVCLAVETRGRAADPGPPRMTLLHLKFSRELYEGTVFRGELCGGDVYLDDIVAVRSHRLRDSPARRSEILRHTLDKLYEEDKHLGPRVTLKRCFPATCEGAGEAEQLALMTGGRGVCLRGVAGTKDMYYSVPYAEVASEPPAATEDGECRVWEIQGTGAPDVYRAVETGDRLLVDRLAVSKELAEAFRTRTRARWRCRWCPGFAMWAPLSSGLEP